MAVNPRRRFWVQGCVSAAATALAVITLISREWIELLTGWDPDNGDGTLEWAIVVALGMVAVTSGVLARLEWHRTGPVGDTGT